MYCQGDSGPDVHLWADADIGCDPKPFRMNSTVRTKGLTAFLSKWTFAMTQTGESEANDRRMNRAVFTYMQEYVQSYARMAI